MTSRRNFLRGAVAGAAGAHVSGFWKPSSFFRTVASEVVEDLTQFVKPTVGTGGSGNTYPGATVPFGMVQLSPDTGRHAWEWCPGYHVSDTSIIGFSHTHLSGTGAFDLQDFLLMPGTREAKIVPGSADHPEEGYRSRFSHADEIAEPGYYSVRLLDNGIRAELSTTERAGIHRYTFPESATSHFILDLAHPFSEDLERTKKKIHWSRLKIVAPGTIMGGRSTARWADGRQLYFAMRFSKPFARFRIFVDDRLQDSARGAEGKSVKCVLDFKTSNNETILIKTGISAVDPAGALRNLDAEIPDWDFDGVRLKARQSWQRELSRIHIETGDQRRKEIFYTGLYHMLIAPTLFDDVDGRYRGMDGRLHQLSSGEHNYSTFSLWDTYRAVHPLYTIMLPERVPDFVNCLIRMAEESPEGMPVWPLHGIETGCMTGYHSAAVVAEACVKKFSAIDFKRAYAQMRKRAMVDDYRGLGLYRKFGYIPVEQEEESVSKTLEYCYDDWAAARVAAAIGETEDARLLLARSKNYRNLFDEKRRFIRPKLTSGAWAEPFDPKSLANSTQWHDFTECNSWQATFGIQHDVGGYAELFGGREPFRAKLDILFDQSPTLPPDPLSGISGLIGQYDHGNEPSHHVAYLYAMTGAPWKTQERVRFLLESVYSNQPNGLAGNEDCGQMSAWYVMSALGFYSVDPVSGNYVLGTPLFDHATVELGGGKQLVIEARRQFPNDSFVQAIEFDGRPYEKVWFAHADIVNGAHIIFEMGSDPNLHFGSEQKASPPILSL